MGEHKPLILIHHQKPLGENLALRVMKEAGSPTRADGRAYGPEYYDRCIELLRKEGFRGQLWPFEFDLRKEIGEAESRRAVHLGVCLAPFSSFELSRAGVEREKVRLEALLADADRWATIWRSGGGIETKSNKEMQWLLRRVRLIVDVLESDFAYGDVEENVAKFTGDDPRKKAWPFMILGPELVARYGRERVLSVPAWKVEELPHGAMWIEATENPFTATRKEIRKLAEHLGLEVVGGGGPVPEHEPPTRLRYRPVEFLAAGVDIETRPAQGGLSILERFERGDFGESLYDPDEPFESFLRHFDELQGFPKPSVLRPFVGRRPSTPREPWQVIVGAKVAETDSEVLTEVSLEDMRLAFVEVEAALVKAGCAIEPAYWTIREEGEF